MTGAFVRSSRFWGLLSLLAVAITVVWCGRAWAGHLLARNNSVGGVSIDVEGVVGPPADGARRLVLDEMRKEIGRAPEGMSERSELRMISLRGLAAACEDAMKHNLGRLPDAVRFLAGIQRIEYVFVYPEAQDIVLAGPGEGWTVDEMANVVGNTTGRPVLQLDDLLVALRFVNEARTAGISCSIDPTQEGLQALNRVLQEQERSRDRVNPAVMEHAIRRAFGPQQISVTGVPTTSRFARVLVAADYHMKRLAMKLDESPVRGMTSYLDLIKNSARPANGSPRWWLACNYAPLAASDDGLAWELRGPGVKAMTEDEIVAADGTRERTGRTSGPAQRWADLMSDHYESLSAQDAVFGDLRNLMDLCVVAALIEKERLFEKAGFSAPILTDVDSDLTLEVWHAPKRVAPEVSFIKGRGAWIVTASGGVQVESWLVASRVERDASVAEVRRRAMPQPGAAMWWQ